MDAKSITIFNRKKMNNSFALLLTGRFISQLGDKLYLIALPWLVLELTHSAFYSALTFAIETLPQVLLAPFIGVFVDRKARKLLMVGADILNGAVVGVISVLAFKGIVDLSHILIASFLLSTFTLLFDSASEGYLPGIVTKDKLVEANANLTFIHTIMRLVGPILSGGLIATIGAAGTVGLNAISFFLSALVLSFLPRDVESVTLDKSIRRIFKDIKEGFHYLFKHQVLFPIAIFSTFMNFGIFMVSTLLIYISKETLGNEPQETSVIFWISGLVAIFTTFALRYLKKFLTKGQMIRYGSLGVLLATALLTFNQSLVTITISYSLILMVGIIVNVNMMAYRQEVIPTNLFGRVMTSTRVLTNSLSPFAMILAGWLASRYNIVLVFEVAGTIILANVIYAWFSGLKYIK